MDKFKWGRKMTCIIVFIYVVAMGIPSSLGFGVWDFIQPLGMSILGCMGLHKQQCTHAHRCADYLYLRGILHQA